jgi:hypothetical protein
MAEITSKLSFFIKIPYWNPALCWSSFPSLSSMKEQQHQPICHIKPCSTPFKTLEN